MKPETSIWLGVAGLTTFLLLGNLLQYADLRWGAIKVLVIIAVVGIILASLHFAYMEHQSQRPGQYRFDPLPFMGLGGLIAVLLLIGML